MRSFWNSWKPSDWMLLVNQQYREWFLPILFIHIWLFCPEQLASWLPGILALCRTHMTSIDNCTECPAGYYCQDRGLSEPTGMCKAGHICYGGALADDPVYNNDPSGNQTIITWGDTCHEGYYCPEGTALMIPCPRGTYNPDRSGQSEAAACKPCDPGKYCNSTALTDTTGNCDPGYYCLGGAYISDPIDNVTGNICPPYHYCEGDTDVPLPCVTGMYANSSGSASCDYCIAGYLCYAAEAPRICPQGETLFNRLEKLILTCFLHHWM